MDYRKIQLTGESTYILSLPKKWVKKNKLDRGDVLGVIERGDDLVIRVRDAREQESEIAIGEKHDLELLQRTLITKYIQGFDSITVRSKKYITPEIRQGLNKAARLLIGMEEFGETSKEVNFRMLMKEKGNVEDTIERMHMMSYSSLQELMKNIGEEGYSEGILQGIIERDNEIDKFYFLVVRQLSSLGSYESIMWIQIAKTLERISDHIEKIARLAIDGGRVDSQELREYNELIEMYSSLRLAIKNKSLKTANEVLHSVKRFRIKERKMIKDKRIENPNTLLMHESFRRIGEYMSDVAEVVVNMN